jgi:hypothetical protein
VVICSAAWCTGIRLAWPDQPRFKLDMMGLHPSKNRAKSGIKRKMQEFAGFLSLEMTPRQAFAMPRLLILKLLK